MNQWSSRHSWCSGQGLPNLCLKSTVRVFILEAALVGSQGKAGGEVKVQVSGWDSREAPPALTCFRALRGRKVLSPLHRCLGRVLHSLGRAGSSRWGFGKGSSWAALTMTVGPKHPSVSPRAMERK